MTCIVGYIDKANRKMYMGGDSAGVDGSYNLRLRKDIKVFQKGEFLFGYTSSFRMGQLLRFKLEVPICSYDKDVYEFMCTHFIDAVRQCLKDNGYSTINNNEEKIGEFLVAFKGRLFKISSDLQVGENMYPYDACGCGEDYAIGSIRTADFYTSVTDHSILIVEKALKVAEDFSAGVRSPFNIVELNY